MKDLSKLTVEEILNIDAEEINRLTRKELATVTNKLVSVANKRFKRLAKNQLYTPAYQTVEKRGRLFSTKGKTKAKNIGSLKNEFKLAKNFLRYKTSTVKGAKQVRREVEKGLQERLGISNKAFKSFIDEKGADFWGIYHKLEETAGSKLNKGNSQQIQNELYQALNEGMSEEDILEDLDDRITNLYEENEISFTDIEDDEDDFIF